MLFVLPNIGTVGICFVAGPVPEGGWNRADSRMLYDDSEATRNELEMFKNRNNRLIDQLREKSMEHSKLASQVAALQKQVRVHEKNLSPLFRFTFLVSAVT